jgi:hypothetical protein
MASTKLAADSCTYTEKLRRSVGPGMYQLGTPGSDCTKDCSKDIPSDPFIRYQAWGPGSCVPGSAINDGSELLGLNYKASKCSADAYMPGKYSAEGTCHAGARGRESNPRDCQAPTESTRLSNPPCTLRATGWNRWEWLCWNPQDRALIPFDWNVSYRIVSKDNYVPCLETPIDQSGFLPNGMETGTHAAPASWATASVGASLGNPFNSAATQCATVKNF